MNLSLPDSTAAAADDDAMAEDATDVELSSATDALVLESVPGFGPWCNKQKPNNVDLNT